MNADQSFLPDWVSPPGDTISDILNERGLSSSEFARQIDQALDYVNGLLEGRAKITVEIARRLESVLGSPAKFWLVRESQYQESLAWAHSEESVETRAAWLKGLPIKDMFAFGWLARRSNFLNDVGDCLRYFDVPDVRTWHEKYGRVLATASFRTSYAYDSTLGAVAAWLRQGEIVSESIDCKPWDSTRFSSTLSVIRQLTRQKDPKIFLPKLTNLCAECGVAVAIVRAPNGCRASGATLFTSPSKALLLLSFRYLSDDQFWFTFFHEAGHLLLHNKIAKVFLEELKMESSKEENEANEFSARVLIPERFQPDLLKLPINGHEVIRFAKMIGISPGIVVGQLQHQGRFTQRQLNNLKRRFAWE